MMGRAHATSGLAAAGGVLVACPHLGLHPGLVQSAAITAAIVVGSLRPDVDSPGAILPQLLSPSAIAAKAARRWGRKVCRRRRTGMVVRWVGRMAKKPHPTPLVSTVACAVSSWAYRATRGSADDRIDQRGQPIAGTHRYLTHTPAGNAAFDAAITAGLVWMGWWWWLGLALFAGAMVHLWGDWLTLMGTPLGWPIGKATGRGRKRWWRWRSPWAFPAGQRTELVVVEPLLVVATVVAGLLLAAPLVPLVGDVRTVGAAVLVVWLAGLADGQRRWGRVRAADQAARERREAQGMVAS